MKNRTRGVVVFTIVLLIFVVFILNHQLEQSVECPFSVLVFTNGESERLEPWENENGAFYIFLPSYAQMKDIQFIKKTAEPVQINGTPVLDGMNGAGFCLNEAYTLSGWAWGSAYESTITFVRSANVPAMYIDTVSGSMAYLHEEKGNEEAGSFQLYTAEGELVSAGKLDNINGRGNSTWKHFEKKPYSITCSIEADLLGMGNAQKWILLANAGDTTHLRNKIVYDFADAVGLAYSPDSQWVDLYLNGEYAGLYLLCERNEVHPERVDIDPANGFLVSLELEARLKDQNYPHIVTAQKHALRIHYPEAVTATDVKALTAKWQSLENAILAADGRDPLTGTSWLDQIDLDSWVRKYLIEELFGNYDAGILSQYFYSDENGRIYAGPVWDYDNAIGLETTWQLKNPQTFFANRITAKEGDPEQWFYYLYQNKVFYDRLVELYELEFMPRMQELVNQIDEYEAYISAAAEMDHIRWADANNADEEIQTARIKEYLNERVDFLSRIWLEETPYCIIRADSGFGVTRAYYVVMPGDCLEEVPAFEDTDTLVFLGWYYEGTNEPFDITKPVTEDIEIYAKWGDKPSKKFGQVMKLVPLGVIAMLGCGLMAVDFRKNRRA